MKKFFLLAVISGFLFTSACHYKQYKYKNFKSVRETHKSVAILPFVVSIDAQNMFQGIPLVDLKRMQSEEAAFVQNYLYMRFKKKDERKKAVFFNSSKGKYFINFQNIVTTNKILCDSLYKQNDLAYFNPTIAAIQCNVDLILSGIIYRSNPVLPASNYESGLYKNRVDIKVSLHDKNGKLLWEYYDRNVGGSRKSSIALEKKIMKRVARKFPYKYKLFQKRVSLSKMI